MTMPTTVNHGMIAAALAALRDLLLGGYVRIADGWQDLGSGPGRSYGRTVEVQVFGHPAARDALLSGMTDLTGPDEWSGNNFTYRDWHGRLLTMPMLITERIETAIPHLEPEPVAYPPIPADAPIVSYACADHPDFVPDSLHHLREHIEDWHPEELAGAHDVDLEPDPPADRPYVRDTDPSPLLDLLLDERYGPDRTEVLVIPGAAVEHDSEQAIATAWSKYARARAHHYFGDKRYPTIEDAREALRYWPGVDMLNDTDRDLVVGQLVDPPRVPEPAPATRKATLIERLTGRVEVSR